MYQKHKHLFSSLNDFEMDEENDILNISEESLFFKDSYYQKEILDKNENMSQPNKNELIIREKLMYFYLNPRKNIAMPKFMKISEKDKRCQQIMTFTDASLEDKIHNFYDLNSCLKFRKFLYKFTGYITRFSLKLVRNPIYDNFFLFVILLNTVFKRT